MMGWQDDTILSSATSAPDAVPALQPQKSNLWDSDPILASAEQLPEVGPRVAEGAIESIQSGYQASVGGLFWRGKLPELVMDPEHAKWWERALSGISQVGMDIPVMGLGGAFGGAAGTVAGTAIAPGPGTAIGGVLGAGAGMFGTPALMREILIAGYQSGEIKTAADFWNALRDMSGHVATETAKEAAIGAFTFGSGGVAARTAGKAILPAIGQKITAATAIKAIGAADTAAQIATMVSLPAALQGRIPDAQEFMDAAIVIGGLKLAVPLSERITRTFVKTGKTPAEQVADAKEHPEIAKEMRSEAEERQAREFSFKEQLTKQEELWSLQSRLVELERKASGTPETTIPGPEGKPVTRPAELPTPLTDAERVERDALRIKVDAIEAETVKAEVPRETIPTGFSPEQLAEARDRAAARIAELTTREGATPLTDAERVERIGLVNALSRPEELARRFEITPERRIPTADERAASAQRVFDDVVRQLEEVDAARKAGGLEPLGDEHAQAVAALVRARVQARAERLGRLPEDIYTERPLKIRDQLQGGEELPGEPVPPEAPRFPSPEVDLFGNKLEPEMQLQPQHAAKEYPVVKVPLADIKLSTDVPQFKAGADAKGVVEPLRGEVDLRGVPPVALWERLSGDLELISGRHRVDLWKRKGMQTIDAQIFKESEGFDVRQATMLDAEMNIRDEHGRTSDYVNYFKNSGISEERAESRGLLGRAKGREGFRIAHDAIPELIAAHRAGLLSDDAALAISQTAPGSERLQVMGIAMVNKGKSIQYATNMMRSLDLMASERAAAGQQIDIFNFDDSAMIEAAAMAKKALSAQRHIAEQISAVNGAAKRPELAREMGVNVEDPEGIKRRIAELRQEQYQWDNWPLYPELVARLRGEGTFFQTAERPEFDLKAETPAEAAVRDAEAAAAAKRKIAQEKEGVKGPAQTVDQADMFAFQRTLFQGKEQAEPFYSQLRNSIQEAPDRMFSTGKATASWLEANAAKMGIKKEEIYWSGITDWMNAQGKVNKAEVLAYLDANGVRVEEKTLGQQMYKSVGDRNFAVNTYREQLHTKYGDGFMNEGRATPEERAELRRLEEGEAGDSSKFPSYQLPGGENYRELLLMLPSISRKIDPRKMELIRKVESGINLTDKEFREYDLLQLAESTSYEAKNFHSTHFNQPNILAHIRMNDRTDASGKKVLFVEEVQSDWGQAGKKKGFAGQVTKGDLEARWRQPVVPEGHDPSIYPGYWEVFNKKNGELIMRNPDPRAKSAAEAVEAAYKEWVPLMEQGRPPTAPFVTDTKAWTALALKRVISYAAENGYDRVAWTTGKQQADRYSLAKQIDSLMYAKRQDGTYQIKVVQKSGDAPTTMGSFAEKDLEGVVGKEIARKIIDGEGAQVPHSPLKHLENVDLKVGGEGMKGFYDQIVPQVANSILKRAGGGKVESVEISREKASGLGESAMIEAGRPASDWYDLSDIERAEVYKQYRAEKFVQPGFDITPEMRAKIKSEGMPLFQGKGQERDGEHLGSYTVAENLITTFKNANKSTIVHELGHSWLEEMKVDARLQDAPAQIRADWEVLRREFAIGETGEISTASHEQFAKTFERYLAEGKAPSIGLRGVFERFKAWMLEVYKSLTNIGAEINPEVRDVFDRMLATDREIADARELGVPRAYVDLARKVEAEKIIPEARKIEPGAEAEQARQKPFADELPPGPGEAPDNIHVNYKYINSPMDVKLAMQRMAEIDQRNIQRQRGGKAGVESWAEEQAKMESHLLDTLGGGEDKLGVLRSGLNPGDPKVNHRLRAMNQLMEGAARDSARLRDIVLEAGHDATVRQQLEYMGSIERARMLQAEFLGERAAVARAMNALKDVTEGSGEIGRMLDVIGYGEKAARELYQTKRTPAEEQAHLKAQLDAIMLNYRGQSVLDIAKLHKEIGSLKGSYGFSKKVLEATTWEKLVEGWKSFLLSGPVTHTTNFFGTEAFHWLQPAVDVLAATIGMARGASPGMGETDRASMSEAIGRMSGMLSGVQDGLKVGIAAMRTGEGTGKTESYREAIPGRAGHIIRTPLRMMGAEDAMVTTMYERGELRTLAIRQAFNENLNPKTEAFAKRVQYLTDHPTPEIETKALATATRMTFNTPYGEKGLALANFINKWSLQWMIPFTRTPINIALEMLRLSPFAPGVEAWRADFAKGGAARDRALAEVTLGVGIASLTMAYAFSGSITGAGSPDPGKNRTKEGVWQPYSIFINGKWYEYSRIQPVGTLMGMAADMSNIWDHMTDEEKDKLPKMISTAFANAITNQTFLQGITNFVNALSDPTQFGPTFLERFAGTAVPNIVAQPAAMMDPHIREVNGMFEAIQARIPGWREGLLPSRDWLGEPRASKERVGVIMPVRTLEPSEDKVRLEAARLNLSMAAPPRKTHIGKGTGKIGDVPLTPEERDIFAKVGGEMTHQILTNIVNAPGYDEMPDLVKRKIFAQVVSASHRVAAVAALPPEKRTDYLQQITERMQAELAPGEP